MLLTYTERKYCINICFVNIFSQSVPCLSVLKRVEVSSFEKFNQSTLSFVGHDFDVASKKIKSLASSSNKYFLLCFLLEVLKT